jgi:hypothetical protein
MYMTEDILDQLKEMDAGILTEVARRTLNLPFLVVDDWTVIPLIHEKVIETTGGLFVFNGHGKDRSEKKAWSVVLKVIQHPEIGCETPQDLGYWRREMMAYQSGFLADLPSAIRTPKCYSVKETERDGWIWLENVKEINGTEWSLQQFQRAAFHLGKFAGMQLVKQPVPEANWMCGSLFRGFYADGEWWEKFIDPASQNNAWQRGFVQSVYTEMQKKRVLSIWADKWRFITANERLPQVFCHNDAHRRNLIFCGDDPVQEDLVVIDWSFCGPGGLGNDLGELVGTSLSYFAVDPAHAEELEASALEGYLAGLREAGWNGDIRLPRLGYLISLALYWGGTLPCEVALAQPGETKVNLDAKYNRPVEALLNGWTLLAEFALDRADEARHWIERIL